MSRSQDVSVCDKGAPAVVRAPVEHGHQPGELCPAGAGAADDARIPADPAHYNSPTGQGN